MRPRDGLLPPQDLIVTATKSTHAVPHALFQSKRKLFWLVAAAVVLLDQLTKLWLWRPLGAADRPLVLIPEVLRLIGHPGNVKGALGLGPANPFFYAVPAVIGLVVMIYFLLTTPAGNWLVALALGLLAGGDVGNMIDRLALHHVRDFIELHWREVWFWHTFNVADSAICIGFVVIAYEMLFHSDRSEPARQAKEAVAGKGKEG